MKKAICPLLALLLTAGLLCACGAAERRTETLHGALTALMTGSDELNRLLEENTTVLEPGSAPDSAKTEALEEKIDGLLREQYRPYFTEQGLEEFIDGEAPRLYPVLVAEAEATAELLSEELSETDGADYFAYSAVVRCTMAGEENQYTISGYAGFSKQNKIETLSVKEDGGLARALMDQAFWERND